MSERYGVSISHYGGASWKLAELERELSHRGVRQLEIRGCPYPEMGRAEQVRQFRLSGLETLVFIDAHVSLSVADIEGLVSVAERHGVAVVNEEGDPWVLEAAAIRRDVIEAMIRAEERTYENSCVDTIWKGEKVSAVPIASPWTRQGLPLVSGHYYTDGQAFMARAKLVGAVIAQHFPDTMASYRGPMRSRIVNSERPIDEHPGSRFALCIPSFGSIDLDQLSTVFQLEKAGMVVIGLHDCPWIDQARSWLTERALELGRGVFFLDHDIIFEPNDVLRLCEQALERDAVVAGAYCMRRSGKNIIGSFDVPPGPMKFFEGGGTHPAYYSGLGFAAVPRGVLASMPMEPLQSRALSQGVGYGSKIRPWYGLDCSTGFYAGEDVSFCNRVHDLVVKLRQEETGFDTQWELSHSGRPARVFLDSRVRIFHRGSYDYGIEDAGIVVPRIQALETVMTASRKEAREILVNALDLPVDVKLGMQEFAQP